MKLLTLKIDRIIANSNQPRKYFDKDKMSELKESIKNSGLLQPITVRKISGGKYEIIAGERRYRACRELGMENIPAIEINTGDARGYELSVLENIQREDLNPIEEAESYLMLMEVYGYTQEKLSEKLGKNRSSLSNKIRILKLPGNVKELVKSRELSYGHARTLLALSDEKQIIELAKEVIEKKYSVRETEKKVKIILEKNTFSNFSFSNILSDKRRKTENKDTHLEKFSENENETNKESYKEKDAEKIFLENKLREFFESSVEIKGNLHENGKIEIKFHDYEELERIIGLLNIDFD
jgi:stage 0 sporulation protein J